jgi:asparagine synthase (glutamine-hydrolysing)
MCGINGLFTVDNTSGQPGFGAAVQRMTSLMVRRGPDDEGFWADPDGHLYLGFRRLAILDTSPAGHQPMISTDGRSIIVFNGEIYNFLELRHELEQAGVRFRSRSDTEVLLEALSHWGPDAVSRLNGMFAFAWYDMHERRLVLARDHAGIKPLYYFVHPAGRGLAFASQFNALLHTPWGQPGDLRLDVLKLFMRLHHIPPPYGLLQNTYQLEPGHLLLVKHDGTVEKRSWWKLPRNQDPKLRPEAALEALAEATEAAVRRQRIADVPLGVFLSGGVDSPIVTAVARKQTGPSLKAFTIGNPGWRQDESEAARTYARHLDVDHWIHPVTGQEALAAVQDVITAQHEPFADFSILPTLLVSRFARSLVTVGLSGDGGDELFFGYERPLSLLRNGSDFRWPWPVRIALYAAGKYRLRPQRSETIISRTPGHYYFEVNSRLAEEDLRSFAPDLDSLPTDFNLYAFDGYQDLRHLANYSRWVEFYGQMQRCLKKVDMASMHHSLEVRVPLLDRDVIDVSLQMDPFDCTRNGTRKAPLRDLLARYVPAEIIPKAKRGFAVPLGDWLRGPLRELVEDTIFSGDLYPHALFNRRGLRQYWESHLSGARDLKWGLWTLLTLQWWAGAHLKASTKELVYGQV